MKNKIWMIACIALLYIFVTVPGIASAHVTVHPSKSSTDAWEKYSVRVPVEKEINTTKLELTVPEGIHLVSVMPTNNWDYTLEKDANENITGVKWTATKEGIGPNEFTEFYFVASNPNDPGEFKWEAFQTYEDDSVVEWTGESDTDNPASVTEVVGGDAVAQHNGDGASFSDGVIQTDKDTNDEQINTGNNNWLPMLLATIAILLALISLFRKRS